MTDAQQTPSRQASSLQRARQNLRPERSLRYVAGRSATYIVLIVAAILTMLPLLYGFFSSLKPLPEILSLSGRLLPEEWSIDNYRRAWAVGDFPRYMLNSVIVTGGVILLNTLFCTMIGYVLSRGLLKFQRAIEAMLLGSLFFGLSTGTLYPQYRVARALGMSNLLGITLVELTPIMLICIFLVKAYCDTINPELEEAGRVDGCGLFQLYWRIVLPLMKPIIATTMIISFQMAWNGFQVPLVFSFARPELRTLVVGVVSLQFDARTGMVAFDTILAGAYMALIPVVIVFVVLQKQFVRGWTSGALKG